MKHVRIASLATAALVGLVAAGPAFADTQTTGTNAVSPTLQVSATVTKAIRLTLASGTGCTVAAGSDYSMNFGTVDALGITAASCGQKFAPTTPGSTPAVYYSDYKLKPVFTSQSTTNNNITAYVSTDFASAAGLLSIVHANSAPSAIADLSAMGKALGSATTVATNATNTAEITRWVGVSVAPLNGAGTLTGNDSATITYTLTVN